MAMLFLLLAGKQQPKSCLQVLHIHMQIGRRGPLFPLQRCYCYCCCCWFFVFLLVALASQLASTATAKVAPQCLISIFKCFLLRCCCYCYCCFCCCCCCCKSAQLFDISSSVTTNGNNNTLGGEVGASAKTVEITT